MTITLELTEDQERHLRESAARHDEATLRRILSPALELAIQELLRQSSGLEQDRFQVLADKLAESFAASGDAPLPIKALGRESIYGDHP